jgi:hypothetical protein
VADVKFPTKLPGLFFILEWDRDRELFVLHVDDGDGSSYAIGRNADPVAAAMFQFKLWGLQDVGTAAIDMAREFGAAKVMLNDGRVVALFNRDKNARVDAFAEQERLNASYASL